LFELKSKVMIKPTLTLNINQPLIIAPMFLVSNTKMVIEGMKVVGYSSPKLPDIRGIALPLSNLEKC
jgi:hypothetical protein